MTTDLVSWALPRLSRLLPIGEEPLKEVISYSQSLSKDEAADHLKNLLGDSGQALEFISSFNSRRANVQAAPAVVPAQDTQESLDHPSPRKKTVKKVKPPLHSAGPVRRPEGYGDVGGGYTKPAAFGDYLPQISREVPNTTSSSNTFMLSQEPAAVQHPFISQKNYTPSPSSSREPSPPRHKLPPSAAGNLISDLPNVKTKQSKKPSHSGTSSPHKAGKAATSSINDLSAAIAALELSTNPSLSSERRICPCNASIHPLFTTAPNCLSCGKIICSLEGLQPCSFCNSPILTQDQVQSMIRALREERGQERMAAHNATATSSGRGTPIFGLGGTTPDTSGDEASGAAAKARAHRDKLLAFQSENAQRTKIHDEAADYDMSLTAGATQWMSPVQRAAALKRQQRYLRELEEQNKPEWEKKKTVMSMSIKNGKLVKTFETVKAPSKQDGLQDAEDITEDSVDQAGGKRVAGEGAFSRNPLLADGKLMRPIWKGPDEEKWGKGSDRTTRASKWRRVQDDEEDNERWILDGGAYGSNDGSKQECG